MAPGDSMDPGLGGDAYGENALNEARGWGGLVAEGHDQIGTKFTQEELEVNDKNMREKRENDGVFMPVPDEDFLRMQRDHSTAGSYSNWKRCSTPGPPDKGPSGNNDGARERSDMRRIPVERWRNYKELATILPELEPLLVATRAQRSLKSGGDVEGRLSASNQIPLKLAINSQELLDFLHHTTNEYIAQDQNVLIRPFKYLVYNRDSIIAGAENAKLEYEEAQKAHQTDLLTPERMKLADLAFTRKVYKETAALVRFMEEDMKDIFTRRTEIESRKTKKIEFEDLWHVFKPGGWVFLLEDVKEKKLQAYRILHVTGGQEIIDNRNRCNFRPQRDQDFDSGSERECRARDEIKSFTRHSALILDCAFTDCDGVRYGARSARFVLSKYHGKRDITQLSVIPAEYLSDFEQTKALLVERGRRFVRYAVGGHMRYTGMTLREKNDCSSVLRTYSIPAEEIESEVVIDQLFGVNHLAKLLQARRWRLRLGGKTLNGPTPTDMREIFDPLPSKLNNIWLSDVFDDTILELTRRSDFANESDIYNTYPVKDSEEPLSDDFVALLPSRLYGYALSYRKWFPLDIDEMEDIEPEKRRADSSYDDLILKKEHKDLLQATIKNQVEQGNNKRNFNVDIVKGKGKGLIILLHGVPGSGKTSTAECIAAQLNRPLLPITCGELGVSPAQTATALESFCEMAYRWRSVLLLDEADVFLARRDKSDVKRNALVSVFLRTLEYFSGVMILTTNRVGQFDEAFRSRIHINLYFARIEEKTAKKIWKNNIDRIKRHPELEIDIEEAKIRRFAKEQWHEHESNPSRRWNGRQIKNAFQTALALANWDFHKSREMNPHLERPLLKADHFRQVAETSTQFDEYLSQVHGADPAELAEREQERKDDYVIPKRKSEKSERTKGSKPKSKSKRRRYDEESDNNGWSGSEDEDESLKKARRMVRAADEKKKPKKKAARDESDDDEEDEDAW